MPIYAPPGVELSPGLERLVFDERLPQKSRIASRARETAFAEPNELEISAEGQMLRLEAALLRETFGGVESNLSTAEDRVFEEAGRSDYLDSIERPTDLSAGGAAERILGGITGYIYRAFQLANPNADLEDFMQFKREALRGLAQGLEEARGYLDALDELSYERLENISETEDLVREGLDVFFEREEERLTNA
jgi:hypothetical protein